MDLDRVFKNIKQTVIVHKKNELSQFANYVLMEQVMRIELT